MTENPAPPMDPIAVNLAVTFLTACASWKRPASKPRPYTSWEGKAIVQLWAGRYVATEEFEEAAAIVGLRFLGRRRGARLYAIPLAPSSVRAISAGHIRYRAQSNGGGE